MPSAILLYNHALRAYTYKSLQPSIIEQWLADLLHLKSLFVHISVKYMHRAIYLQTKVTKPFYKVSEARNEMSQCSENLYLSSVKLCKKALFTKHTKLKSHTWTLNNPL